MLLAGLGNTAHVFDDFALQLTAANHVYGITRRGFGASSAPASGYAADRMGDDVLAVLDSLRLRRPVLAGHSGGGSEMSSIGSRHSERVAGLVYLDAGYGYAYYGRTLGDLGNDTIELLRALDRLKAHSSNLERDRRVLGKELPKLNWLEAGQGPVAELSLVRRLLETSLPRLERDLREFRKGLDPSKPVVPIEPVDELLQSTIRFLKENIERIRHDLEASSSEPKDPVPTRADLASFSAFHAWLARVQGFAAPESELRQQFGSKPGGRVGKEIDTDRAAKAIIAGNQKYTEIHVPILAIFSVPHGHSTVDSDTNTDAQARAFEQGLPDARVVRVPHAHHYVYMSNQEDVLREMRTFLASLP